MNISLPESMRTWIEQQVSSEGYGTTSEYFRALVREDQKRKAKEELEHRLLEAIDSGEPAEMTSEDWEHIRNTVRARLSGRKDKDK